MHAGEIEVDCDIHPSGHWITLGIAVGAELVDPYMVLDSASPVSVISPGARDELERQGLLPSSNQRNDYLLTHLSVQGQPLPDITVRVLPRLTRLGVDGLLGLDFFQMFEEVCFRTQSLRLTLHRFP